jgi:hypothetical protein
MRHAEWHDAGLANLASEFAADFAARAAIRHTSFGWQYDAGEVFILRTFGAKRYLLRENT